MDNLIAILNDKTIYAMNAHCLVKHAIESMGFSPTLQRQFYTTCFTETPLTQIKQLTKKIKGRRIELAPYGLVFWKNQLFNIGASPAIYINAKGTSISKFLLDEFRSIFNGITQFKSLKEAESAHYKNIVHYYSLINVVKDEHDFMWEREWRHHGDFRFTYRDVVAIVAQDPDRFRSTCQQHCNEQLTKYLNRLPIISPDFTYEELIEELAEITWAR
ncbi:MAG: hypothetical protein WCY86_14355 [Spirosomataceae bacterium]